MSVAAILTSRYRREWRLRHNFLAVPPPLAGWNPARTPRDEPMRSYHYEMPPGMSIDDGCGEGAVGGVWSPHGGGNS